MLHLRIVTTTSFFCKKSSRLVGSVTSSLSVSRLQRRFYNTAGMDSNVTSGARLPVWQTEDKPPHFPQLNENISADVTVIGAGISGLTTAYALAQRGKSVVLLEDGNIVSGESSRTTAMLMSGVDDHYVNIAKKHGKETARLVAESHSAAIDFIETACKKENIQCDFSRIDGFMFPGETKHYRMIEDEFRAATEAGLEVELLDSKSVPGIINIHGPVVKYKNQGQIHPIKYLYGLAQAASKLGVKIFTQSQAKVIKGGNPAITETANGSRVTSQSIVVATNAPVNDRVTMYTKMEYYRTYVVAGVVKKSAVAKALYWDTLDPYHYVRYTEGPDADHLTIMVGGEDGHVGQHHDWEKRYYHLMEWARERFPVQDFSYKWSGQILEPVDDLAFIGRNPGDYDNVYIITGDSGNGMTHGTLGAMLIRDLILGVPNHWAKIYDPSRKPVRDLTEFVKANVEAGWQYKEYLTGSDVTDIEDIKPGCGAVIRKGLSKQAVYRDETGKLHSCSAVCTHLKGIVNWNDSEKTWDCPVHGSRFDPYGKPIMGPANEDLGPYPEESK